MVTKHFGTWLAGFIDGEGCFRVTRIKNGFYYSCAFYLKLRDDDRDILEQIVEKTGIGYLTPLRQATGSTSNPCLRWTVHSQLDALKLVALIDRYPLRSKKSKDYKIWRKAVRHWTTMKKGNRWIGHRDWTRMVVYKKAIEDGRAYRTQRQ